MATGKEIRSAGCGLVGCWIAILFLGAIAAVIIGAIFGPHR